PTLSPGGRFGHSMAYDSLRGMFVLFGGTSDSYSPNADTYEWNGTNWTARGPMAGPPGRYSHSMAFDTTHGVTVLFGGYNPYLNPSYLNDTWLWNGGAWSHPSVPTVPTGR